MSALAFRCRTGSRRTSRPRRGRRRDDVRLLVADAGDARSPTPASRPAALPRAGDLVVVNTSATLPAALPARRGDGISSSCGSRPRPRAGRRRLGRRAGLGDAPFGGVAVGERFALPGGGAAELLAPLRRRPPVVARLELPAPLDGTSPSTAGRSATATSRALAARRLPERLRARARQRRDAERRPAVHGRADHAARAPGRPRRAVTLHTGVSSQERHERPYPERYRVPEQTARLVNAVHGWGGRVIAIGTTVVRALETVASRTERWRPARAGRTWSSRPSAASGRSTA